MQTSRNDGRKVNELRPCTITPGINPYAEGSCLIQIGQTHVLCTASVLNKVPSFLKDKNQGWLTAEYGMLPRATHSRSDREAAKGKQSGRTQEIQRLIGRSLRQAINLSLIPGFTIQLDCDVLQADGGTRCASITGAFVALQLALATLVKTGQLTTMPKLMPISAVSVGVIQGCAVLDLSYDEDSQCDTDMNLVMTQQGDFIEIQGTAEGAPFSEAMLLSLLQLGKLGNQQLQQLQAQVISLSK